MGLRKGDTVLVLSGKNKGKKAKIIAVSQKSGKITVEGVNVVKKHQRPTRNFQGGIIEKPLPIFASKVMLVCPRCGEPTRIGTKVSGDKRVRVCGQCEEIMDKA
ncbi:50S ribosomal protein L24 [candidate division WOR-1 bacterium RIFCSPHIGHO2_01_FULL_53_15]|uniref:Large ribosomal subunit protein uL24 n=1 Tax=candidate division WOR-1 bacterium RIFCSPHIGHO2_01_FULL_53_15 TaxID=1802564 RepID=A0A1F4Q3N5_UNCSA|nr:MAG: 50S ribosomal protein L24 [candidate division WOR-1 bacterium RIFCSPHIGHO2_01_FULL_53_15]OGC12505.1 MAG: 50S ribosomal protein L24 [candidate division WOR-1 bacterium RIFCSPHIGHO2_02_FULL_53_26]